MLPGTRSPDTSQMPDVDLGATYMPRMKYMMAPMITIQMKRQRSNIRQLMVGMGFLMG